MSKRKSASVLAGSNWLAIQKSLRSSGKTTSKSKRPKPTTSSASSAFPRGETSEPTTSTCPPAAGPVIQEDGTDATKEVKQLRNLVLGLGTAAEELVGEPGRYLALDCEMVGVGENGKESSLARASIVDFHGRVVLDEFVQQRERVTDYRTQYSGVRPQDMVNAKPFRDVQARVAELLAPADRILVGHALHNDLAVLLLTHPASRTRDTQIYAGKKPAPHSIKGKQNAATLDAATHSPKTLWEKYRSPRIGLKKINQGGVGCGYSDGAT